MNGTSDFMSGFMTGQNSDRNNMWGGDNGLVWILLIFAIFGFGGNNFGNRASEQIDIDTRFIERDIFNTNQNVSNTACQTQREVANSYAQLQAQLLNCCCDNKVLGLETRYDLGSKIDRNNYDSALQTQNVLSQMAQCCCGIERNIDAVRAENYKNTCEITTAIHAEGEATRALINANTMQDLRDRLNERDRELQSAQFQISQVAQTSNIINALNPPPIPAYTVCAPFARNNCNCCGCNL